MDKKIESISLPAEIESSLSQYGGIEGFISALPTGEEYAAHVRIHRALADPMRLKIISLLKIQPLCVCVIKAVLNIADSKLSYHLNVLKKAGLVSGKQTGNWIIYSLTEEGTKWSVPLLRKL